MFDKAHHELSLQCEKDFCRRTPGAVWLNEDGEKYLAHDIVFNGWTIDVKLAKDPGGNLHLNLNHLSPAGADFFIFYDRPDSPPKGLIAREDALVMVLTSHPDVLLCRNSKGNYYRFYAGWKNFPWTKTDR